MLLVFPYIILGALFGRCAGGQALIKLAFSLTRNLRGGPAHAAVVSSAMFGTITGGPVVNVLSTGVLFNDAETRFLKGLRRWCGGRRLLSGSIMPPIMSVAAFIMASLTGVPYRDIIIAAAIPALFYPLPVSFDHLSGPQAEYTGHWRANGRHAAEQPGPASPPADFRAGASYLVLLLTQRTP